MSSADRDSSRGREMVKHQHSHSFSEHGGRIHIPMWDSSDPERAPPPLPLNPGSPNLTTRANASATIAAAAKALEEKARESLPASSYTTNPMPQKSPERSLIKGAHKRMQSLQPSPGRDLRSYLDGYKSPDRSPERPGTRAGTPGRDYEKDYLTALAGSSPRTSTPTPVNRDIFKDTPALTPALRPALQSPLKPILGENTPPSATMWALQNMSVPRDLLDPPLANITNSPSKTQVQTQSPVAAPLQAQNSTSPTFEALSSQLLSLTNIAAGLQKEMAQLSRRSKDNATDLISLKEATNSRDEDIRKCLRELVNSVQHAAPGDISRSSSTLGVNDPHMTPNKQFTIPRMASPASFFPVDERIGSPNPYSVEGAASVAMLEKIIREMVTKDGQERLLASLSKLVDKATGDTQKKVAELVEFIKEGSQGLVSAAPTGSASFQPSPGTGPLTRATVTRDLNNPHFPVPKGSDGVAYSSPKAADFVSDQMLNMLRKIKDSVAETGGFLNEHKALTQTLRKEVSTMGRELAQKLEQVSQRKDAGKGHVDIASIVQNSMADLKQQLDQVMRDHRRQSNSTVLSRTTVDNQEVAEVVRHVLTQSGLNQVATRDSPSLDKDSILAAVKEAYEAYRPEIELQQFGLERDEVLQCLREGLEGFQGSSGITREEVMETIRQSLQQITLPQPINEFQEIRDEVLCAVRECLEEFKPSLVPLPSRGETITREDVLEAIKEGLSGQDLNGPREIEINRDDLLEAVKAGLQSTHPAELNEDRILEQLQTIVDDMHTEFKAYSSANGRDTEQVLDAIKDGLENLRGEIEAYVDKAQDVTQKDEIVETMRAELERLRRDVQGFVAEGPQGDNALSRVEMVEFIKHEFEHLLEQLSPPATKNKEDILEAINSGFEGMKSQVAVRGLDLDTNEEINEAMKAEFEQLKDVLLSGSASDKHEILQKLESSLEELHGKLGESLTVSSSSDEILKSVKEEFEYLRETLATSLIRSGGAADKDEIVDSVRELMDGLRSHLTASQDESSQRNLNLVREELEHLREALGSTLIRGSDAVDKEELLETLRAGFDEIKSRSSSTGIDMELLEAIRGDFEQLRQAHAVSLQNARADTEELLDAVRLGLDDLRSHLEKKIENPEHTMSATGQIIEALNDGLDNLRSDVAKVVDKPVDMTISYEILDTLKEGIASLKADIDRLKESRNLSAERDIEEPIPTGTEVVLAENPDSIEPRDAVGSREVAHDSPRRNDLEKMEVMLAQLQVKVDTMDENIRDTAPPPSDPAPVPGSVVKEDLIGIEELIKDVQAAVTLLEERERASFDGMATKEDTDALETLLCNIKAKVEDMVVLQPDPETIVTKEHFEQVEIAVRTANDTLEALSAKIGENAATKEDVAVVEVLVQDMKTALDEMKTAKPEEDEAEKITKTDIDTLSLLVEELKIKFDELKIPDPEDLPSKADVEQLTGLIHDFRESHDKMKDSYEADIAVTAKAFDDRKKEAETLAENMTEVRAVLDEIKVEMKASFEEGGQGVEGLKESFQNLEAMVASVALGSEVKELMETLAREFERAHSSIEGLRNEHDEKSTSAHAKTEEAKDAIITGLCQKVDERFDVLMTKYDDAQLLADEQARVMKEKAGEQEEILASTKAMAEELRLSIDTLGASVTGMDTKVQEATQKSADDAATLFARIDDTIAKLDVQHIDEKGEHQQTRDEISNALRVLNALDSNVTEYHPKFMVTLREILALVNQHYEHSQKAKEAAEQQVRAIAEDTRARTEEIQSHFIKLPALLPPPPPAEPVEQYDDSTVQEKLDKLLHHADDAEKSSEQIKRLDEIHKQVMATAMEVSEFVTKQTQMITDGHESKEREAEELALLIERRVTQKEQLETDVQGLREEKDSLLAVVAALQAERENLANQKIRLTGEVSSLQTALDIRREELQSMENKADTLERRILNGIMDHSRALMIGNGRRSPTKAKKAQGSDMPTDVKAAPPPSVAANGLSMALKPRPAIRRNGPPPNPASRRILSLSQITSNVPTGAAAYTPAPNSLSTSNNLKRSHSVKTNYLRKSSWTGKPSVTAELNKENETLNEENESDLENNSDHGGDDDLTSQTGTELRHSYAGSYAGSHDGESSYSGAGSEYTYASGSYMTGSDIEGQRTTSYGSIHTRRSTLGGTETIDEDAEDSHSQSGSEADEDHTIHGVPALLPTPLEVEPPVTGMEVATVKKELHVDTAAVDSGVGSELETAALELHSGNADKDYFRRAAEEESTVG